MLLQGKNAIITGCKRGIGKAILEVFARQGANIWACCRQYDADFETEIQALACECGVVIIPIYFDLTNSEQMNAGIKAIIQSKKQIDILVNNAGMVGSNSLFQMTSIDKMKAVFEVNFFAQMKITQYISKVMMKQNQGNIIFISSIAGIDGEPAQLEYAASKAALIGATKKLAHEFGQYNIRVNAIAPGATETDMLSDMSDSIKEVTISKCMMNRLGKPTEIANVVAMVASDMSAYLNGQIIRVDGGM